MRCFILIDPCLSDHGSHPYQYAIEVLTAADRAGFACEAVVHRDFQPHAGHWPERFRVEPVLDVLGHSKYTVFGELDRLSADGSPRLRLAAPWTAGHAERRRRERIAAFARSMAPIVRRVSPGDVVLLATASELDVAGLADAIRSGVSQAGASWHALFHYPLYRGLAADFPRQERRLDRLRRLLADALAAAAPERIHIHVTTPELAAQYARLGVAPIRVLPYPVQLTGHDTRAPHGRALRVLALGDARPEKGSQHLAAVVERTAGEPGLAGRVAFAIQSNLGCPPGSRKADDRAVLRSMRRLAELTRRRPGDPDPLVELLQGPLMGIAYEAQLCGADATILAYDQHRYHSRCSGVLLESLAAGVVPIVTGGGSMGRMLADPIRSHIEALLARSRLLATERHRMVHVAPHRPWQVVVAPPAGATAFVVSLRWMSTGPEALLAVPATIELGGTGFARVAAIVAADEHGHGSAAVLPLRPGAAGARPLWIRIAPTNHTHALDLAEVTVSAIDSGARPPVGAAGIVVPPGSALVDALVDALVELVGHPDHYLASARQHAAAIAGLHSGSRVVETLMAAAEDHAAPTGELRSR